MKQIEDTPVKKKGGKGRKALTVIGILFIFVGVFLGAFVCSFQVMIQAEESRNDEGTVQREMQKLREENQLLQDQITILEAEVERAREASLAPTARPASTTRATASSGSSSSGSSSSGSTARPAATSRATTAPTRTPSSSGSTSSGSSSTGSTSTSGSTSSSGSSSGQGAPGLSE